jgi:hypothetical protein
MGYLRDKRDHISGATDGRSHPDAWSNNVFKINLAFTDYEHKIALGKREQGFAHGCILLDRAS